jgi:hypothetical protein
VGVSAERVLQKPGELGVTVGDVHGGVRFGPRGVAEGGDDVAEGEQTAVNGYTLFDTFALSGGAFQL